MQDTTPSLSPGAGTAGSAPHAGPVVVPVHTPQVLAVCEAAAPWEGLQSLLGTDHALRIARGGGEALAIARDQQPDLILIALLLPDMTGFELLRRLKADPATDQIGVVFITGQDYVGDGIRSLGLGAADYVTTPFNEPVFKARVGAHLRIARYRREVEELNQQDRLTGLFNRRHFDRMLSLEARRAQRSQTQLSVALVEVDAFRPYNDHFGRAAGDQALAAVGRVLGSGIRRPADLAARYFGETFGILIPETSAANALKVVQALHADIAALKLPHPASKTAPFVTASVGLATTEVGEDGEGEGVLQRASRNLSRAQAEGRNRVVGETA